MAGPSNFSGKLPPSVQAEFKEKHLKVEFHTDGNEGVAPKYYEIEFVTGTWTATIFSTHDMPLRRCHYSFKVLHQCRILECIGSPGKGPLRQM